MEEDYMQIVENFHWKQLNFNILQCIKAEESVQSTGESMTRTCPFRLLSFHQDIAQHESQEAYKDEWPQEVEQDDLGPAGWL